MASRAGFWAFFLLVAYLAAYPSGREALCSASCGPSCDPSPVDFHVPAGERAQGFRIVSIITGNPCSGKRSGALAGFSIRRGQETVLVYYQGPGGTVSDPVSLEDLELSPGKYQLFALPAAGASVTLSYSLMAR